MKSHIQYGAWRTARGVLVIMGLLSLMAMLPFAVRAAGLDAAAIGKATGLHAVTAADGVVRVSWARKVPVTIDGESFPPAAGIGAWAAFKATSDGEAITMSDTAVFRDEVDAAIDAALAHGLDVTALHNHFFYDHPKVYFLHTGGEGDPLVLAAAYKDMWGAIQRIRARDPHPAEGFPGMSAKAGHLDVKRIETITGLKASAKPGGVVKVSQSRAGHYANTEIGGTMGLTTWAAFVGSDKRASADGDFIMTAAEVQPVLKALRHQGLHIVALHNHMIGDTPHFYFLHFWGTGKAADLAQGFRAALDAQVAADNGS